MMNFNPKTAQPGSLVTVNGLRLSSIESMKLGSERVDFVIKSPTQLVFKVPMNMAEGTYSVEHNSEWGRVIVQDALTVAGTPVNEELRPVVPGDSQSPVVPGDTSSPVVDPEDIDGDGRPTNEDNDIDGDGVVNGEDSDIDGDTITNERDPNVVVPNDPSEALPETEDNAGGAAEGETNNGFEGGLLQTNPLAGWLVILLIAIVAALGAAPAAARARRQKKL
jgi:hypothetical protein